MGKHLNLSQRIIIESNLNENTSLKKIGDMIGKPHTTICQPPCTESAGLDFGLKVQTDD